MQKRKRGKYNNKIIKTKDGKFDSKKEYSVWLKLKRQQELGKIKNLQRQVPFVLIPTQYEMIGTKKYIVERECKYIADFVWIDCQSGENIVADCKGGIMTPEFIIKRKLMLYKFGIKIKIIE